MVMERINFKDGNVYHDYHWNTMQKQIAKEIKEQDIISYYDSKLLLSDYEYSFIDPMIDVDKVIMDELTRIDFDTTTLTYKPYQDAESCIFKSQTIDLPEPTSELMLYIDLDLYGSDSASYEISTDEGSTWQAVTPGTALTFDSEVNSLKLKVEITIDTSSDPPQLFEYCLMWK